MALNRAVEINHGRGLPGNSTPGPQAQRSRKGFVHRLLGKIKITEQADQSCQDSPRIHAVKGVEQFAYLVMYLLGGTFGHDTLGHNDDLSKPATPNQFGKRRIDAGRSRQSAQVVTLKSGQQNASSLTQNRLAQNRQCTDRQVEKLLSGTKFRSFASRDEQEVAGYAGFDLLLQKQIPSMQSFSAFHFFSRVALTLLLVSDRLRN
jgi:hypothetical protein